MILLDANAVLELLIPGRPRKAAILNWLQLNQEEVCISMLSVHLILHFGFKENLTVQDIKKFLANYPKIALLPEDYSTAMQFLRDKDHEDALQLATAERIGCSSIVTLDQKFADTYKDRINFITV
ncbi:MAG: type II toxin-antitoxin system VapC family toxin [Candidatus Saccharimonadales bacterium]